MRELCGAACLSPARTATCGGRRRRCAVRSAVQGDQEARERVFSLLYPAVLAHARKLCADAVDAQDLAQNALLTAFQKLDQLRNPKRLLAWVGQIVRTTHLLSLRRRHFAPLPGEETSFDEREATGPDRSPVERMDAEDAVDAVLEGIAALSDGLREVLRLRVFESQSTAETARRLGISEVAVRTRLKRARQALRVCAAG